jgi:hypothetical protein
MCLVLMTACIRFCPVVTFPTGLRSVHVTDCVQHRRLYTSSSPLLHFLTTAVGSCTGPRIDVPD